jgi:Protein of unknown function (DUF4231)
VDADTASPSPTTATGPAPVEDRLLNLVWRRHRQWSVAADVARKRLDRWRLWNLVLLVLGALMGALAAQTWLAAGVATGSAAVAAVCLGLAGLLQAHALTTDESARWTHARAASEALKAETYRYLMRVAPYAQAIGRRRSCRHDWTSSGPGRRRSWSTSRTRRSTPALCRPCGRWMST